jgi:hypothetical protein
MLRSLGRVLIKCSEEVVRVSCVWGAGRMVRYSLPECLVFQTFRSTFMETETVHYNLKINIESGMVLHTYNPRIQGG